MEMNQAVRIQIGIVLFLLMVPFTVYPKDSNSDLCLAAYKGDAAAVKALLDKGVDVNAKDSEGLTALMCAASMKGHPEVVKMLLAKGADVNAKYVNGATALMYAAIEGDPEVTEMLLVKGADVNAKDDDGITALMLAAMKGHSGIAEMLLAKGAGVTAKDADGTTALMYAEKRDQTEIIRMLKQAVVQGGGSMKITSPEFKHNEFIPARFTCQGEDISPALVIEDIPEGAKSLALIMDDPDPPMGTWVHWVVYDIPVMGRIEEQRIPGKQGKNNFGRLDYGGPCPPSGTHRYFFKIYALDDEKLNLDEGASKGQLEKAMQGHILGKAELIGLYEKTR